MILDILNFVKGRKNDSRSGYQKAKHKHDTRVNKSKQQDQQCVWSSPNFRARGAEQVEDWLLKAAPA